MLRYYGMTMNRSRYFRWTPKTVKITIMFVAVIPTFFGVLGYKYDVRRDPWKSPVPTLWYGNAAKQLLIPIVKGKWDFRGKQRGDLVAEF